MSRMDGHGADFRPVDFRLRTVGSACSCQADASGKSLVRETPICVRPMTSNDPTGTPPGAMSDPLFTDLLDPPDPGRIAELLSKVSLETISVALAGGQRSEAESLLGWINRKAGGLIRDEMHMRGRPDAAQVERCRAEIVAAMQPTKPRRGRWSGPFAATLKRIWTLYGAEGVAKANDDLALRQLRWAMRDLKGRPPEEFLVRLLVDDIAEMMAKATQAAEDLELVAGLPDLPVWRIETVLREDRFSGNEYDVDIECDGLFDLSELRERARSSGSMGSSG
ncbi:MAG: FliG C-terminal domain-containing protein [Alphaproteobacteria bacterium]